MKNTTTYILLILSIILNSCHEEWLDSRRNKEQVVPQTLDDLQALLDNSEVMNKNYCYLGELSTTDLNLEHEWWLRAILVNQNAYIWKPDIYEGEEVLDWELNYERILYANTVLSVLEDKPDSDQKNTTQGSALFFRAYTYYKLAQIFCKPYDPATASSDLGLPLQLKANINEPVTRSSVEQTYSQIISDLDLALQLLPENTEYTTRPTLTAAHSLYAKVGLLMQDYQEGVVHANEALSLKNDLVDYNTLDQEADYPLQDASEIIFYGELTAVFPIADYPYYDINPSLLSSYEDGDLRKDILFRPEEGGFNGAYSGRPFFGGIATNEIYLVRAECHARLANKEEALADLNTLLEKRYTPQSFVPVTADSPEEALLRILEERRKELPFRGLYWEDLRRLNKEPQFAITLSRTLDGKEYELPPNDLRYTLPIPSQVIQISEIEQNPR